MNELIIIEQLPIIRETLQPISDELKVKIEHALSLPVTEESKKEVKDLRAELNTIKKDLDAKRISIKNQILEPYDKLDKVYRELIAEPLAEADAKLKESIEEIDNAEKRKKSEMACAYFIEYAQSQGLEDEELVKIMWVKLDLNVTLGSSNVSLQRQCSEFIDKIVSDLNIIKSLPYALEIEVEYMKTFDATSSIAIVNGRNNAIEEAKRRASLRDADELVKSVKRVEKVINPALAEEELTTTFTVTATLKKLQELKEFMKIGGYKVD